MTTYHRTRHTPLSSLLSPLSPPTQYRRFFFYPQYPVTKSSFGGGVIKENDNSLAPILYFVSRIPYIVLKTLRKESQGGQHSKLIFPTPTSPLISPPLCSLLQPRQIFFYPKYPIDEISPPAREKSKKFDVTKNSTLKTNLRHSPHTLHPYSVSITNLACSLFLSKKSCYRIWLFNSS